MACTAYNPRRCHSGLWPDLPLNTVHTIQSIHCVSAVALINRVDMSVAFAHVQGTSPPSHAHSGSCIAAAWTCRHHSTDDAAADVGNQPAKSLFVVNIEGRRHNGPLLIGLIDYFERHLSRVVRRHSVRLPNTY